MNEKLMTSNDPRATVKIWLGVTMLLSIAILAGCLGGVKKSPRMVPADLRLMWPEPPLTPRIKFVRVLASETDLGRKQTAGESFKEFLTGEKTTVSRLYQPRDVAVSDDGKRIYVSDYAQFVVFRFDLEKNEIVHIGADKPFARPFGVALDGEENLYVVEQAERRVRVLDREGNEQRTITHPSIVRPTDIAIDRVRHRIYVADPSTKESLEHNVKVFDMEGSLLGIIGKDKGDCKGCLYFPTFITVDSEGNVYVSNTLNARVDVFDTEMQYVKTIGERGTSFGMFDKPKGIAIDTFGNIYVVDSGWSNVQIFNPKGQVLLFFGGRGSFPGLLKNPTGIHIDKDNKIYVADYLNYRVIVYELVNTTAEDSYIELDATEEKG